MPKNLSLSLKLQAVQEHFGIVFSCIYSLCVFQTMTDSRDIMKALLMINVYNTFGSKWKKWLVRLYRIVIIALITEEVIMGLAVFNYKRCDNAKGCPVIEKCAIEMGVPIGQGAVYYDNERSKVMLDSIKCEAHECKSQVCVRDCADCFTYCDTFAQKSRAEEAIHISESVYRNDNGIIDRYNAEETTDYVRIKPEECYRYVMDSSTLVILEITANSGCCSSYDSIQIWNIMPKDIYYKYYKKTILYEEKDIIMVEADFQLNELPALLFYYDGKEIGRITGIYRHCEKESEKKLREKTATILSPYNSFI